MHALRDFTKSPSDPEFALLDEKIRKKVNQFLPGFSTRCAAHGNIPAYTGNVTNGSGVEIVYPPMNPTINIHVHNGEVQVMVPIVPQGEHVTERECREEFQFQLRVFKLAETTRTSMKLTDGTMKGVRAKVFTLVFAPAEDYTDSKQEWFEKNIYTLFTLTLKAAWQKDPTLHTKICESCFNCQVQDGKIILIPVGLDSVQDEFRRKRQAMLRDAGSARIVDESLFIPPLPQQHSRDVRPRFQGELAMPANEPNSSSFRPIRAAPQGNVQAPYPAHPVSGGAGLAVYPPFQFHGSFGPAALGPVPAPNSSFSFGAGAAGNMQVVVHAPRPVVQAPRPVQAGAPASNVVVIHDERPQPKPSQASSGGGAGVAPARENVFLRFDVEGTSKKTSGWADMTVVERNNVVAMQNLRFLECKTVEECWRTFMQMRGIDQQMFSDDGLVKTRTTHLQYMIGRMQEIWQQYKEDKANTKQLDVKESLELECRVKDVIKHAVKNAVGPTRLENFAFAVFQGTLFHPKRNGSMTAGLINKIAAMVQAETTHAFVVDKNEYEREYLMGMLEFHVKGMEKVAGSFGIPAVVQHSDGLSDYEQYTQVNFKSKKEVYGYSFEYDIFSGCTVLIQREVVVTEADPSAGIPEVVEKIEMFEHFRPKHYVDKLKFEIVLFRMTYFSIEVNKKLNLDECCILRDRIITNWKNDVLRFKTHRVEIGSNARNTRVIFYFEESTDLYIKSLIINSLLLTTVAHFMNVDRPAGFELVPKPRLAVGDGAGAV